MHVYTSANSQYGKTRFPAVPAGWSMSWGELTLIWRTVCCHYCSAQRLSCPDPSSLVSAHSRAAVSPVHPLFGGLFPLGKWEGCGQLMLWVFPAQSYHNNDYWAYGWFSVKKLSVATYFITFACGKSG